MDIQVLPDGRASFRVRVIPRARANEVQGVESGAMLVRLAAPPVEGKANQALRDFLAGLLEIRRSQVEIRLGEKSRWKVVAVGGIMPEEIRRRVMGV